MNAAVQRDIDRLQGLQNDDGGFPYWRRSFDSIPFNTIHVAHALYRAQSKGYTVPADMQARALDYLRQIESHYPAWYDAQTRHTLSAYALYVRHLSGDRDPNKALQLLNEAGLDNLTLEAIGWLWPVLEDAPGAGAQLDAIRRYVTNHVVETAGAANFTTAYSDQTYLLLSSDRRTDAILLDALIVDNPQGDLIPKIVNGLLAHRSKGHWGNTQEDVFVLLALDHYFNTFEAQTPDFVARLWLGNTYAGSLTFQGRSTERQEVKIPMTYLTDPTLGGGGTQNLILNKEAPAGCTTAWACAMRPLT
jgi:alpha-2-macroglobulin